MPYKQGQGFFEFQFWECFHIITQLEKTPLIVFPFVLFQFLLSSVMRLLLFVFLALPAACAAPAMQVIGLPVNDTASILSVLDTLPKGSFYTEKDSKYPFRVR